MFCFPSPSVACTPPWTGWTHTNQGQRAIWSVHWYFQHISRPCCHALPLQNSYYCASAKTCYSYGTQWLQTGCPHPHHSQMFHEAGPHTSKILPALNAEPLPFPPFLTGQQRMPFRSSRSSRSSSLECPCCNFKTCWWKSVALSITM